MIFSESVVHYIFLCISKKKIWGQFLPLKLGSAYVQICKFAITCCHHSSCQLMRVNAALKEALCGNTWHQNLLHLGLSFKPTCCHSHVSGLHTCLAVPLRHCTVCGLKLDKLFTTKFVCPFTLHQILGGVGDKASRLCAVRSGVDPCLNCTNSQHASVTYCVHHRRCVDDVSVIHDVMGIDLYVGLEFWTFLASKTQGRLIG